MGIDTSASVPKIIVNGESSTLDKVTSITTQPPLNENYQSKP